MFLVQLGGYTDLSEWICAGSHKICLSQLGAHACVPDVVSWFTPSCGMAPGPPKILSCMQTDHGNCSALRCQRRHARPSPPQTPQPCCRQRPLPHARPQLAAVGSPVFVPAIALDDHDMHAAPGSRLAQALYMCSVMYAWAAGSSEVKYGMAGFTQPCCEHVQLRMNW